MKCLYCKNPLIECDYVGKYSCNQLICQSDIYVDYGKITSYFLYFKFKDKLGVVYSWCESHANNGPVKPRTSILLDGKPIISVDFIEVNMDNIEEKLSKFIDRITNMLAFA
jgi:hypothetical protein